MPKRFLNVTPPLTETYSFSDGRPCLVEDLCRVPTPDGFSCRYGDLCTNTSPLFGLPLRLAYGEHIQVTLAEPSCNIVSRRGSLLRGTRHQ